MAFPLVEKIEATLSIEVKPDEENMLISSLEPDSKGLVEISKEDSSIVFKIIDAKISTITNVIDDILRCYSTFKNVVGE